MKLFSHNTSEVKPIAINKFLEMPNYKTQTENHKQNVTFLLEPREGKPDKRSFLF